MPAEDDVVEVGLGGDVNEAIEENVGDDWPEDRGTDDIPPPSDVSPMHSAFAIVKFNHDAAAGSLVKAVYQ